MNWINIKSEEDLKNAIEVSFQDNLGVVIFKHSTRCSISSLAKNRLSSDWDFNEELPIYYLDLISYRAISSKIAEQFNVQHESPQLLILKNGVCIYDASHMDISVKSIHNKLNA
ncbi:MAG: bacillithiol system redox-active protein YtxJ [Vicingaceae bacterium]|nr:bacillithiol system redox-active protein YtxJ [Vicingaceae bacterium]